MGVLEEENTRGLGTGGWTGDSQLWKTNDQMVRRVAAAPAPRVSPLPSFQPLPNFYLQC
jgi:hypothetical protein